MAAGLGFKDFVTGEVLTAADVDGYLMQGVWVFASAAARDAAVTSPQEGNFAYLKDTNVTTYYTGSAWANLDTTGMTNPMTTTGDTIYSSSGSTPARLGIGTAGQVLQVNSGATAPEWATASAGALTKINTTSFTAVSDVATDSLFSSTYDVYRIVLSFTSSGSNNIALNLRSGGVDTSTNYVLQTLQADDTTVNASRASTANFANFGSTGINAIMIDMFNPNVASRTNYFVRMVRDGGAGATANQFVNACTQTDSTQFTGIKFIPGVGTITGSFTVYGYEK